MKKKNILFFYLSGRKEKINGNIRYAEEMFYGYHYFNKNNYQTDIIEFSTKKGVLNKIYFLLIEKKLRNILKLPIYWSFLTSYSNLKQLTKSNYAIFSNNRVGFASLIIISIAKLFRKKPVTLCFVMGLFSRVPKYRFIIFLQNILLRYFTNNMDKLIFLGKAEYDFACNKYPKKMENFYILPFSVDLKIWNVKNNIRKKRQILFVGNDGFRDFKFAEEIANNFKDLNFVFVSQQISKSSLSDNSKVYNGSWGENSISDSELSDLYNESYMTIVPLKNSLQPSGQSVTLQSMACGTPVIISKTEGFWDNENLNHNENIVFTNENDIETWKKYIEELLVDTEKYNKLRNNGLNTIKTKYDLNKFSQLIEKILLN